jgi:hypothetical protein
VALAAQNLERWNTQARADRAAVISLIAGLSGRRASAKDSISQASC